LPRLADCKSAVLKHAGSRQVEHYHQLPPFIIPTPWVPKPKSSRRTVVNRVINECKSRRDRCCTWQYLRRATLQTAKSCCAQHPRARGR